jgi:glycosyltransferase involved in cell wall biosynthesis
MSRVDVVIPCYNYGKFLADCVAGALDDQPGTDVRVLIIDDASTDDSAEIAQKLVAAYDRAEVIVHPVNQGHIATYNEGLLDWADGDYCVLISADDKLTPKALGRATDLMDAHPEVGFVYGNVVSFRDGEELRPARTTSRQPTIWPGRRWLEQCFRDAHTCIFSPEVVVRTSAQHEVGGYDPALYHTADLEMWMRLAACAHVGFVHADQAYKRTHASMMSGVVDDLLHLDQRRAAYEAFLKRYGDALPDAAELSDTVHRELAEEALWVAARAYDQRRTDTVPVEKLIAFAFDCWPAAASLSTYRSLHTHLTHMPTRRLTEGTP